jgi:hypothetical protein
MMLLSWFGASYPACRVGLMKRTAINVHKKVVLLLIFLLLFQEDGKLTGRFGELKLFGFSRCG